MWLLPLRNCHILLVYIWISNFASYFCFCAGSLDFINADKTIQIDLIKLLIKYRFNKRQMDIMHCPNCWTSVVPHKDTTLSLFQIVFLSPPRIFFTHTWISSCSVYISLTIFSINFLPPPGSKRALCTQKCIYIKFL